jgi:hypothetical protein
MGPAWSTRLMAGVIVAALSVVGVAFLLAAAYMALAQALSPSIAALILGAALVLVALLVTLITSWVSARVTASVPDRRYVDVPRVQAEAAAAQAFAAEAVAPELGEQLGVVLRNLNPVTIGALVLGAVVGLLRDRTARRS